MAQTVDSPPASTHKTVMQAKNALKVLILGSGGREHALVKACRRSPRVSEVICAPGNGGIATEVRCLPLNLEDKEAAVRLAREEAADLVVIGPEAPLALGLADDLRAAGLSTYGPGAAGARLEASKAWCKEFYRRHGIPTASYGIFRTPEAALAHLQTQSFPIVVKASGLAAGKGVIIARTKAEAEHAVLQMLSGDLFGESGREIVIESFLEGEEVSLMLVVCGDRYLQLPPSQDHKRVGDGDTGPNTGGMGAYAPTSVLTPELNETVRVSIIEPTLRGMRREGIEYRGTLYIGIILTPQGPQVLEFNTRFGDPETQVLLPLLQSDPVDLLLATAEGKLEPGQVRLRQAHAAVVVLAAEGYPAAYRKGDPIHLPEELPPGVEVVHAGTARRSDGTLVTAGGRVLGVTAVRPTLAEAIAAANAAAERIQWPGRHFRKDIGHRELSRPR